MIRSVLSDPPIRTRQPATTIPPPGTDWNQRTATTTINKGGVEEASRGQVGGLPKDPPMGYDTRLARASQPWASNFPEIPITPIFRSIPA